jgi:hypothetical protein
MSLIFLHLKCKSISLQSRGGKALCDGVKLYKSEVPRCRKVLRARLAKQVLTASVWTFCNFGRKSLRLYALFDQMVVTACKLWERSLWSLRIEYVGFRSLKVLKKSLKLCDFKA